MTRDQAEELVFDLIQAVRNYERADRSDIRYHREEYEALRDKIIGELSNSPALREDKMTEILLQKAIKLPTGHQLFFLQNLADWDGCATTGELSPQISQKENSARQTCKRRGWATFDRYYWRLTDAGREALRVAISSGVRALK